MSQPLSEVERLSYLSAMGIESYVPRIVLPGALPSILCESEMPDLADEQNANSGSNHVSRTEALKKIQDSLGGSDVAAVKTVNQKVSTPSSTVSATTQVSVRFHWVIFQPDPAMLLLVPSAHTDRNCMQLLTKILIAIGVGAPSTPLENFVWPPLSGNASPQRALSNSLDDARETLHALLEGYQLKQKLLQRRIEQVLVFDENLGRVLFDNASIPDIQVRILPSLQLMLSSSPEKVAELKQTAWQRLKDLKK